MGHTVPEEIWLVGKGPSLHSYEWQGHETAVCINESVFHVPNPFAAIAVDYKVLDQYKDANIKTLVLRKNRHTQYQFENQWIWFMEDAKLSSHATAVIAVQLLYKWGARKIHFVGFDAMHGDCTLAEGLIGSSESYPKISSDLHTVIDILNIEPIWEHLLGAKV